jgi:hypothetical protein
VEKLETTLDRLTPEISISYAVGQDDQRLTKANTILRAYNALGRFDPILIPFGPPFGLSLKNLATMGSQTLNLMLVFVMGAIGSLLYITKHRLTLVIQGQTGTAKPARALSWYIFRPIFGIVVAFAIFLLYKAGQIALSAGTANAISADVNVPILSVVSLFAGLLSWQALETIETKGKTWFRSHRRRDLWATGLDSALKGARPPRTIAECGNQIGRSQEQVERWIRGLDKVPPEMQDRISTWIERDVSELFSDIEIPTSAAEAP